MAAAGEEMAADRWLCRCTRRTTRSAAGIVPINKKYGLADILAACRAFPLKSRARITFEYVMLAGVNDRPEDARRLAERHRRD